ncbi:hypothetical protein [Escherichia fergusonii]|uniref:Uncharacterized protein n=2 Tax=Escherichia fergusonii TaxID=564 RepID=A0A7W3EG23_ESCFE|nr:hypothetical protein [Escherichia fergusonii]EHG5995956.1 hypothetical protein [Escherichia fergusonii]EHG6150828.1 hypothetical protein [Escherichia fergusonii]EHG6165637.1 hypothetical protein [Escherichia fergusonii]EHG6207864.1 hypothetical protein [Escherichia fergusonii]EHG7567338.1 hypothetical protein [Escherichia fergusonii]
MAKLRKIVVAGRTWLWVYRYYYADERDCYLRIISEDKKTQFVIYFRTATYHYGDCPFNNGLPALYNNVKININLNQPRFVAQLLTYVLENILQGTPSGVIEFGNGNEMLQQLGYEFDYK